MTTAATQGGPTDFMLLPLDGSGTMQPRLDSPFSERNAQVSPDGRWVVYTSNETGRDDGRARTHRQRGHHHGLKRASVSMSPTFTAPATGLGVWWP